MRSRLPKSASLLAALAATVSCGPDWRPVTDVKELRVLAIRAEPPELVPGATTRLSALVVDPSAPGRVNAVLWLACDPDPTSPDQPACAQYANLDEGSQLASGTALPPGMRPLTPGPGDVPYVEATYEAPAELFASLAADDPVRRSGKLAFILAIAVAAAPPTSFPPDPAELEALMGKIQSGEVPSVYALKRVRISEDTQQNRNPQLEGIRVDDTLWKGEGLRPMKLSPGERHSVAGEAASWSAETYQQLDADDNLVTKTERLILSWFSTYGVFSYPRTLDGDQQQFIINSPFDELPADGRGRIYVVLRDGRGGTSWAERAIFICDPFAESPEIASVEPASGPPGTQVTLRGTRLEQALDVQIGAERFLAAATYDAERGGLTGVIPSDIPLGSVTLQVRGRSCRPDPQIGFAVTAP